MEESERERRGKSVREDEIGIKRGRKRERERKSE